ncbi:rCG49369 [Rattus norvegicus]|uniref:RCG49369 n=1 Tax=Rattus norvegicus TaxID=10116 RepID=A6J2M7_RAT|nr:rCG49369 [Rattus norvegicus]
MLTKGSLERKGLCHLIVHHEMKPSRNPRIQNNSMFGHLHFNITTTEKEPLK